MNITIHDEEKVRIHDKENELHRSLFHVTRFYKHSYLDL